MVLAILGWIVLICVGALFGFTTVYFFFVLSFLGGQRVAIIFPATVSTIAFCAAYHYSPFSVVIKLAGGS